MFGQNENPVFRNLDIVNGRYMDPLEEHREGEEGDKMAQRVGVVNLDSDTSSRPTERREQDRYIHEVMGGVMRYFVPQSGSTYPRLCMKWLVSLEEGCYSDVPCEC